MAATDHAATLERIDAALRRIEAATRRPRPDADPLLAARHQRLRRATAAAVAEIDAMIRTRSG